MLRKEPLQFQVVTPLYLGGADPRAPGDARVYVRPVVAQWRWWFRALAGGVFGTTRNGLAQVRAREQKFFGGVHKVGEAETGPMRFRVRLVGQQLGNPVEFTANRDPVLNYLGFGLASTRDQAARLGIPPGSRFTLEVVTSDTMWDLLCVLNYFWVNFGGLGARHRRGLGSIEWISPAVNQPPQDGRLARGMLDRFRQLIDAGDPQPSFGEIPEMPVVHPGWFRVKLAAKSFSDWKQALSAIRNQLRIEARGPTPPPLHLGSRGFGYRQGDGASHRWVQEFKRFPDGRTFPYYPTRDKEAAWQLFQALKLGREKDVKVSLVNPLFGLPVVFGGWNLSITAYQDKDEIRRPSPLSFRVFRSGNSYRVAIVYFKSRFLPENSKLRAVWKSDKKCPVSLGAGWEYLDGFFERCEGTEVKL
jgi:CRISPR type III-B/RAMP module RAMP protein Cmr1